MLRLYNVERRQKWGEKRKEGRIGEEVYGREMVEIRGDTVKHKGKVTKIFIQKKTSSVLSPITITFYREYKKGGYGVASFRGDNFPRCLMG